MAFCQNCGSAVEGKFCAKCGAAVGMDSSSAGSVLAPGASGLADNLASALCYVPLIGALIFLFVAPYNRNKAIRFHAFQALMLFGTIIALEVIVSEILFGPYYLIRLIRLGSIALWAYLGFKTYSGQRIVLPVIGSIAEKQA